MLQSHVLAELFNCNNLVLLFIEMLFNLSDEISAIPFASACDYLNVFRINTESVHYSNNYFIHYPYFGYAFDVDMTTQKYINFQRG